MKILEDKYPKGSLKGQKSAGRYIDGYLYKNLEVMADAIVNDMTFMGVIFSSTFEVGTGKSVFATQIGEAWSEIVNRKHNTNLEFTTHNIVWRPKELIKRSFEVPRYSCILLDEWEDATYWSQLGISLRQFFRKCRQLNLFMLVIIPNWFQMPLSYAVSRSTFAIDVRFETGFQRGFFNFYGFENKKNLYIKGKKFHNYKVTKADFYGRFGDGYGVPRKKYMEAKREDLENWDDQPKKPAYQQINDAKSLMVKKIVENFPITNQTQLAKVLGVSRKTIYGWIHRDVVPKPGDVVPKAQQGDYIRETYDNVGIKTTTPASVVPKIKSSA